MIRNVLLSKTTSIPRTWYYRSLFSTLTDARRLGQRGPKLEGGNIQQTRHFGQDAASELSILALPLQYLRSMDGSKFDANTHQRCDVRCDPVTGKPMPAAMEQEKTSTSHNYLAMSECSFDSTTDSYRIKWGDGLESEYSNQWVEQELSKWRGDGKESRISLWSNLTDDRVRNSDLTMPFQDAVLTDDGGKGALKALYQYGIVLITNTPTDDKGAGVAALAAALGGGSMKDDNPTSLLSHYRSNPTSSSPTMLPHGTDGPMRTLYGGVWSTSSSGQADGTSIADSAYGQEGLPLHTDMTYQQDPPGLQIFTMAQPAVKGGESVFGDGFAVAERLRTINPEAFATLSQTIRRYHCIDTSTGWHLEAHGPVILVRNDQVVGIRHNDLDRLPDLPPLNSSKEEEDEFYDKLARAHQAWDELLAMDEFRLVMPLQAGDTMVVANHRSFHGRCAFETTRGTSREVMGCYMSQDELNSRFRQEGFILP